MEPTQACDCPMDSQASLLKKVVNNLYLLFTKPLFTVGQHAVVSATFTRPANITAYDVNDVISNSTLATTPMLFANIARALGKGGYITKAQLTTNNKAFLAACRLWLFTVDNPTVQPDNSPYRLLYANQVRRVGYIDFLPLTTEDGTNSDSTYSLRDDVRLAFACDVASRNLWGVLENKTATGASTTPTSGQSFTVELEVEQN